MYRLARLRDTNYSDELTAKSARDGVLMNVGREVVDALEMAGLLVRPEDEDPDAEGPELSPPDDPPGLPVVEIVETVVGYEGRPTVDGRLIAVGALEMGAEWVPVLRLGGDRHGDLIGRALFSRREIYDADSPQQENEILVKLALYEPIDGRIPTFDIENQAFELQDKRGRPVDVENASRSFFGSAAYDAVHVTTAARPAAVWLSLDPDLCWTDMPMSQIRYTDDD